MKFYIERRRVKDDALVDYYGSYSHGAKMEDVKPFETLEKAMETANTLQRGTGSFNGVYFYGYNVVDENGKFII